MGLDMYLSKKTYVGANYTHRNITGTVELFANGKPIQIKMNRISYIEEQVGYWRKANHIHRWFVENVQGGKDDCGEYEVMEDQLTELLNLCKKIKADKEIAPAILPTASGFFFGSTDYDEYYMNDIDDTISIIEELFKDCITVNGESYLPGDIYYSSSW